MTAIRRMLATALAALMGTAALCTSAPFTSALAAGHAASTDLYDVVIAGGRVIDPESTTDAVRDIGIRDGRIAAVSTTPLKGKTMIKAKGLVVAPGFIDLHAHGQQTPAAWMKAFDGVTTALELESGVLPVGAFYEKAAAEGRPIHYGVSASWSYARIAVMEKVAPEPTHDWFLRNSGGKTWSTRIADADELSAMTGLIEDALKDGAIGIGINLGYAPGSGRKEFYEIHRLAARHNVPTFTHVRYMSVTEPLSAFEAYEEMVAVAASTGARMHICHLNSTSLRDVPKVIELLQSAQKRGVDLSVEAYPYSAASTIIGGAMFRGPGWKERLGGARESDFTLAGKPLDPQSFAKLQQDAPGTVIVYNYLRPDAYPEDQQLLDQSLLYPGGAIASDSMPWLVDGHVVDGDVWPLPKGAYAHPRSAGTFARFLREYVRERQMISLMDAIGKMTLIPARILEASVPQMQAKGRIRPGADADIVVFDLKTITDHATFTDPARPSEGVRYLLVNGTPVIRDGALDRSVRPGQPIRRPIAADR